MTAWHRFGRLALVAFILVLFTVSYSWLRSSDGGSPTRSASEAGGKANRNQPRQVLILRHAEKSQDDPDIHLTSRGAARAAALPSLFLIPPTFPTKGAPFATPDFIYATKATKHSNRSVETVTPLAKALGLAIHHKHANNDFQAMVEQIFGDAKHAGKTVLICWHHGTAPDLSRAIVLKARNSDMLLVQIPGRWEGSVFDRVWNISFEENGNATFVSQPQKLLFGDSKK